MQRIIGLTPVEAVRTDRSFTLIFSNGATAEWALIEGAGDNRIHVMGGHHPDFFGKEVISVSADRRTTGDGIWNRFKVITDDRNYLLLDNTVPAGSPLKQGVSFYFAPPTEEAAS